MNLVFLQVANGPLKKLAGDFLVFTKAVMMIGDVYYSFVGAVLPPILNIRMADPVLWIGPARCLFLAAGSRKSIFPVAYHVHRADLLSRGSVSSRKTAV